jgi:hypothetical protein
LDSRHSGTFPFDPSVAHSFHSMRVGQLLSFGKMIPSGKIGPWHLRKSSAYRCLNELGCYQSGTVRLGQHDAVDDDGDDDDSKRVDQGLTLKACKQHLVGRCYLMGRCT